MSALEVLRCLDSHAAGLFKEIVPFALGKSLVPDVFNGERGLGMGQLLTLVDANLVSGTQGGAVLNCVYEYGPWLFRITPGGNMITPSLHPLTKAGRELIAMTGVEISPDHALYAIWICKVLTKRQHPCEVALAQGGPWTDWKEFFKDAIAEQARLDAEEAQIQAVLDKVNANNGNGGK